MKLWLGSGLILLVAAASTSITPAQSAPTAALADLGFTDYRGVIHAHSYLSHDSEGTQAHIVASARQAGLDFVLMTDHQNDPRSIEDGLEGHHGGVLFATGAEVGVPGGGSLLGLGLQHHIPSGSVEERIADVERQGGQAWAGHVESWRELDVTGLAGMELYNFHYDATRDGKIFRAAARALRYVHDDLERAVKQFIDRPILALKKWDAITQHRRFPIIAGNDSHENVKIGRGQLDPYPLSFRVVNTHVLVRGPLTVPKLVQALREGRAYLCHELFAPGEGVRFWAQARTEVVALLGEELTFRAGLELWVVMPREATVTLFRDGQRIARSGGSVAEWTYPVAHSGVYRVELDILDPADDGRLRTWIYSNPIYVRDDTKR